MTAAREQRGSDVFSSSNQSQLLPADQPSLYSYNRRLRHLRGISLRNLVLATSSIRSRGKTIDDESLPQTWKSPEKLLALRQKGTLTHSHSSSDLQTLQQNGSAMQAKTAPAVQQNQEVTPPKRPNAKMRRRSTLHWTGASPAIRQKKLEDVADERLADVFFSIECIGMEEPVYVSEVVPRAMNPSFNFFDLNEFGPVITRQDQLLLKIWTKAESVQEFSLLIEYEVNLSSLQFLGRELGSFPHPLPENCILFHLSDGIYTSFTDMPVEAPKLTIGPRSTRKLGQKPEATTSFDSLMRLANLDDCIQDALSTREQISGQIDTMISKYHNEQSVIEQAAQMDGQLNNVKKAVEAETKRLQTHRKHKTETISSLEARRQALKQGINSQHETQSFISKIDNSSKLLQKQQEVLAEDIQGQRRRISEDLMRIFPIEPVPDEPLSFTIRGLHLPNTSFEDADEDTVAAALGYVAELVYLVSCYLYHPLPYPLNLRSSTSTIEDPIAIMAGSRIYPLFAKGSVAFRFEYGVFLLDKNIEVLLNKVGLKALDIRHTLPNIKYLLYVLAAGKGEVPARKAGGIKGLLSAGHSPALSRTNSQDSDVGTWTKRIAGSSLKHKHAATRHRLDSVGPA